MPFVVNNLLMSLYEWSNALKHNSIVLEPKVYTLLPS